MTLCGWKIFSKSKQRAKRLKNETIPPSSSDNPTPVTEERAARESAVLESDQDVQDEWSQQSDSKEDAESIGNPRNKCALKPGHSLMDWIRFGTSGVDLAGTKGVITPISMAELAKHNKLTDAWLAIRGKVYNVTHYMDFHPGGPDEIAKGLGKDATKMFDEVHAWVNYEQLLMKCYIGPLRSTGVIDLEPLKLKPKPSSANGSNFKTPILPFFGSISEKSSPAKAKPSNSPSTSDEKPEIIPRFDWIQKTSDLILVFYTKPFCNPGLIVTYKSDSELDVRILIERTTYLCCFKLSHEVKWPCLIKVTSETGKIELILSKLKPELWTAYGILDRHKITNPENIEFEYSIAKNVQITHDSYALVLKPVQKTIIITPIGYHISVTAFVNGDYVTRRYTPVPAIFLPTECANPYLPLLIKSYTSGVMAKHITSESYDSVLKLSQPKGNFLLSDLGNHVRVGLLAAGSGITPILGILDHLTARNINKVENIQLLLFNKTEEDIWCRQRLEDFAAKDNRLIIRHVLSEPQDSWTGETGRISEELISSLTDPKQNFHVTYFCVCGPTPFNDLSEKLLKENGFTLFNMHFFQG